MIQGLTQPVRYFFAALILGAALAGRLLLDWWLGDSFTHVTALIAILFIAWYLGKGAAVAAAAAGYPLVELLVREQPFGGGRLEYFISSITLYALLAGIVIVVVVNLHTQRLRSAANEAKAKESEERFRLALSAAGTGWWSWDLNGDVLDGDERVRSLVGLPAAGPFRFQDVLARCLPEDRAALEERARQLRIKAGDYEVEYRIALPGGETKWLLAKGHSAGGGEKPTHAMGTLIDITRVKKAQEEQRKSDNRFKAFFHSNLIGAFFWDMDGRIHDANEKFLQIIGYSRDELLKGEVSWAAMTPPEYREADRRAIEELKASGIDTPYEKEYFRKDGSRVPIFVGAVMLDEKRHEGIAYVLDITERKHAEDKLRKSEKKFRAVFEQAAIGIGRVRLSDARWIDVNDAFCDMLGYTKQEFESTPWPEITHPDDVAIDLAWFQKMAAGELDSYTVEKRFIHKDGHHVWACLTLSLVRDVHGKPDYEVAIIENITHRKKAEEELRISGERLRATFDNAGVGIVEVEENDKIIAVNNEICRILGRSREELLQLNVHELTWPDDREISDRINSELHAGRKEKSSYDKRYTRGDGTPVWVHVNVSPIFDADGRWMRSIATVEDITHRKAAEEELRQERSQLQSILDNSPVLISTKDLEGRMRIANRAVFNALDVRPEAFIGRSVFELFPRDVAESLWKNDLQALNAGGAVDAEETLSHKDGALRTYLTTKFPLRYTDTHEPFGVCAISVDITERKRLEEELKAAAVSAEAAKRAAEEANAAKDQFLAVLSHELRTPLAPVLAAVQLMEKTGNLSPVQSKHCEIIRRNLDLETRLIDDLLDVTRIVRGKIALQKEPLDICSVLGRVVEVCKPDIEARRLHFSFDCEFDRPQLVYGDASRLQQVVWNLVKNAVKFTPDDGCLGLSTQSDGGRIVVEVSDSGIGIEPGVQRRIFDAFEQADRKVTRQFGGLGLGLAISKRLVEMHDGTIEVHSEGLGKGTTFKLILPLYGGEAQTEPEKEAIATESPPSKSILLVEDHGDSALMMQMLLESSGFKVRTAGDVKQALEAFRSENFDFLISDLGLPDRSGLELIRELRASGSGIKAVALSGFGREEDIQRSKDAGFLAHLTKPIEAEALIRTINSV